MDPNKIDSNVLMYYMDRINNFLASPRTSQVFPGLSKDIEDVLVHVAGQNELKLQGFDDDFKALLSDIKSELNRKKDEYQLSYDFQELACGTRSLIYTKIMVPVMFKQPEPLRKPNSMNPKNKQPSPALSSDLITQSFKLRCLNATLKFIKDDSSLSLRYPEMATVQAQHIVNMFQHNNSDEDIGLGYKTLYAPLWEAMKIFGLKYKFTLRYTDPKDKSMKCLVLDKIPIVNASKNKENQDQNIQNLISFPDNADQNTSKISPMDISDENITLSPIKSNPIMNNSIKNDIDKTNSSKISLNNVSNQNINSLSSSNNFIKIDINNETFKKPIKLSKLNAVPKLIDTIKLLGDDFMTRMYKKILKFMMDETEASMIFTNMSPEEAQVLTHWNQIMITEKYKLLLSGNCMFVLSQLSHNYKKMDFSVMVNEGRKKSKTDNRRNITFIKVPFGEKLTKEKKTVGSLTSLTSRSSVETNSSIQVSVSNRSSARQDVSATRSSARQDVSNTGSSARRDVSSSRSSARRDVSNSRSSASQALGTTLTKPSANTAKTNKIKMKLLEGLDQPVTSDKAMKMMLNMGWEGGALGTRGEGITEPIRPSLDTGKRYGLGAPVEEPRQKTGESNKDAKSKQYHTESLKLILNLLTSTSNSKEITFPERYMRKEWNYIKNVVILFNKGIQISTAKKRVEVIDKIIEIMYETDWILTAGLMTDRITIVIKKSILPLFPNELKLYCEIAAFSESRIYNDGSFKNIYKGIRRNNIKHVDKPGLKGPNDKKNDIVKKNSSTELNTRSGSKDQYKDKIKSESFDDLPIDPIGNKLITEKNSNDLKNRTELSDDFKMNVLANILLFCQTNIEHKFIKFGHVLIENQRMFIKECIEKVNTNTSFLEKSLETRFYEQIIDAMDGYKIDLVFSSPCSINLEKEYPFYDLTVKNTNNNVTIHYYDEDIESDGETKDIYLDPEQSFVDDDKNDACITEKGDDQNNNVQDSKINVQNCKFDVNETNKVQNNKFDVKFETNNVQNDKNDVQDIKINGQDKKTNVQNMKLENGPQINNVDDLDDYNSDYDIQIIEGIDTITITSGDESDLLKSDNENDLSINKIISKLNHYKTSSKEKTKDTLEKVNLKKDKSESVNTGDNVTIKVENDFENTHATEGEISKELGPGKRSRSNSVNSLQFPKRLKRFCKKIAIVPEDYPQTKMDDDKAREIQILLLDAINNHSELPLLKCHGIKNGTLIYNCYTEETFNLIEKIVTKANLKITYEIASEKCNKKMAFRITTYIEETANDILARLVKFNQGLNIDDWFVIKKEQHSDFVVIFVNIDNKSYSYLKDVNFSLYAGVDVAIFTHVWD